MGTPLAYIFADPTGSSGLSKQTESHPDGQVQESFWKKHSTHIQQDNLAALPIEIIHVILTHLPSKDVAQLRLASRWVSQCAATCALQQAFWRSRFSYGFKMGFALGYQTNPRKVCEWRQMYFQIKLGLRSPDGFASLKNRKRTWNILSKLSLVIHLLITGTVFKDSQSLGLAQPHPFQQESAPTLLR